MNPVALVTGASRGIGRSIARTLASRGAAVAVHFHRNEAAALEVLAALDALGGSGHALFSADIADAASCVALIDAVMARFGRLDVLVNNAGVYEAHDPREVSFAEWEESWRHSIAANLTGPAHLAFLAARRMRAQGGGRIVNISSRGAFRGEPQAPAYGAAKAGLNSLGQSLAKAFAQDNVLVFTVAPGWVATDMAHDHLTGPTGAEILAQHPMGRVGTPEEVADAAAWFALDAPPLATGSILDANGASYLRT